MYSCTAVPVCELLHFLRTYCPQTGGESNRKSIEGLCFTSFFSLRKKNEAEAQGWLWALLIF